MTTAQTKKYQRKLVEFKKLVDIVTLAIAVLETSVLKVLNVLKKLMNDSSKCFRSSTWECLMIWSMSIAR